ncbi:sensor histidine kinase [Actinomadura scrupuli]|uniref:sensor histidine kinase n=1 Tax=Actinomadura scrupuli TaxID=559629 RepID=UPI003D987CA2
MTDNEARALPPTLAPLGPPRPPKGLARLRLGRLYGLIGAAAIALVLAAIALAGTAVYANTQARGLLINKVDPAALQQFQLSGAVGGQDTAVRTYVTTRDPRFLTAYRDAVANEAKAIAEMRRLLRDVRGAEQARAQLASVGTAMAVWRTRFADPLVADVPARGAAALDERRNRLGQDLFLQVRAANSLEQRRLTSLHNDVDHRLRSAASTVYWAMGAGAVIIVLVIVTLMVLIRQLVVRPLTELATEVREVTQGDFGRRLGNGGPAEIAELGAHIDAMRYRIIDEWRFTSEARQRLDEQATELRRSNADLEQFAYVASHDLQEPLRKVASFCQMIERRYADQLDDRGRQYIDFAVDGAKRMQLLINDLLTFSRVGRHRTPEPVDMTDILGRALDNLTAIREETGAEITSDPLPHVTGDRTELVQLLQNLIGNAVKFHGDEPPKVRIGVREDGGMWEFSCSDNGIGIDPRYGDRIFVIFQRLHAKDLYEGTGIGLAMCKKIVENHGGRIWLEAPEGPVTGTTIRWTLPSAESDGGDGTSD